MQVAKSNHSSTSENALDFASSPHFATTSGEVTSPVRHRPLRKGGRGEVPGGPGNSNHNNPPPPWRGKELEMHMDVDTRWAAVEITTEPGRGATKTWRVPFVGWRGDDAVVLDDTSPRPRPVPLAEYLARNQAWRGATWRFVKPSETGGDAA
jgi:hypothetical protein